MRSLTLKTKAALTFTAMLLVVLGAVCVIQLALVRADMIEVLQNHQFTVASSVAEEIDDKLQICLTALSGLADTLHPESEAEWDGLQNVLENRPGVRSMFDTLAVIDAQGYVVAGGPRDERSSEINVADRPWFRQVLARGATAVSAPVKSRLTGDPVVILAAPVRDRTGKVVAVINGALNLFKPNFLGHIGADSIGKTGSFALLALDRTIIMARDRSRVMTPGPPPGASPYFDRAMSGAEGVGESSNSEGARALYAYKGLRLVPWVLTARLPVEEAFAPVARAQAHILMLMLAAAVLSLPLAWFAARRLLLPLDRLRRAIHAIRASPDAVPEVAAGGGEIGALAAEFNALNRERAQADARTRERAREAEQSNEELKAFSYSVSHDLRGPLRSMDGFALVLMEDYYDKLDEEGRDALTRIRAASQTMGALIDDLLRLSQVSRADLRVAYVDLSAMARDIAAAIDQAHPGRRVEWAISPGLEVRADAALMRIALQNLLQNAWKFSARAAAPAVRVGALARHGGTVFFVADNGVGFDMAHAGKLFGPFQRLHQAGDFPGTGIGLAIVQRIISRHGGEIRAEAAQDQGATFYFSVKEPDHGTVGQDHPAG